MNRKVTSQEIFVRHFPFFWQQKESLHQAISSWQEKQVPIPITDIEYLTSDLGFYIEELMPPFQSLGF